MTVFGEGKERKKDFWRGGRENRLKRLISDKESKENQSIFLGKISLELGLAWLGFDKFGIGLAFVIQRRSDKEVHAAVARGSVAVDATPAFMISVSRCAD